ncbi:MAG TPA: XRE family transcriptional regulator, partial [Pyrinomonadaceae bacterium]
METTITESSGNVFADLGFEPPEAAILEMRASLMSDLSTYIKSSGMTDAEAAAKFRIAKSRVS